MSWSIKLRQHLQSDWVLSLFLLGIFLATNGYIYGWDDQHLEIPLLKSLIDNGLYQGDYYVQSLKANFPSYFYILLSKTITIAQIPAVYLFLYLISRYFLFFWSYKLWHHISKKKLSAFLCVASFILMGRVEEFLYRTFSHQEFTLAIIMAGVYFFYRERFYLASIILGVAANFHAIYSLFPMTYLGMYLLLNVKTYRWEKLIKSSLLFLAFALPVVIRVIVKYINTSVPPHLLENWLPLYKIACPQNFLFLTTSLDEMLASPKVFLSASVSFALLLAMYVLNQLFHKSFKKDKKVQAIALCTLLYVTVSFIFTYLVPKQFMLDLNLVRNIQYLLFFLVGYTTIFVINKTEGELPFVGLLIGIMYSFLRFRDWSTIMAFVFIGLLLLFRIWQQKEKKGLDLAILMGATAGLLLSLWGVVYFQKTQNFSRASQTIIWATLFLSGINYVVVWIARNREKLVPVFKKCFIIIPLVTTFVGYSHYHYRFHTVAKTGEGFWQMQREWEDMQRYVRENTPKDAYLMVPHDMEMGGFRIGSERKIILSYRDCGIIGFDYRAAIEWQNRLNDVNAFQVFLNSPIEPAVKKALLKYKVNYVVFMRYYEPSAKVPILKRIYTNDVFSLYQVLSNPL